MQRSIFTTPSQPVSKNYSFINQEIDYARFRPVWPVTFAAAALQQANVTHSTPIVVIIGSGAGADAQPFLELGCIVYAIEPNQELRKLAIDRLSHYQHFHSIDGNAHTLQLPENLKADLIVCAQALHTFNSEINGEQQSESIARSNWKSILPDDGNNRISIWYYNLDPQLPAVVNLHDTLMKTSINYKNSKTPFLNAPMFEPEKFQHYIKNSDMQVSTAQQVDKTTLTQETLLPWLRSYSFFPKDKNEILNVTVAMNNWFDKNKNANGELTLTYVGFIAQGPLRTTPYLKSNTPSSLFSPITLAARTAKTSDHAEFWPDAELQHSLQRHRKR